MTTVLHVHTMHSGLSVALVSLELDDAPGVASTELLMDAHLVRYETATIFWWLPTHLLDHHFLVHRSVNANDWVTRQLSVCWPLHR